MKSASLLSANRVLAFGCSTALRRVALREQASSKGDGIADTRRCSLHLSSPTHLCVRAQLTTARPGSQSHGRPALRPVRKGVGGHAPHPSQLRHSLVHNTSSSTVLGRPTGAPWILTLVTTESKPNFLACLHHGRLSTPSSLPSAGSQFEARRTRRACAGRAEHARWARTHRCRG